MSFIGTGSFGNYDLTAQMTGAGSPLSRQTTHEQHDDTPASPSSPRRLSKTLSRTRSRSVPEMPKEKEQAGAERDVPTAGTGNGTDTAVEDNEEDDAIEEERRASMVQALARKFTAQSQANVPAGANVFKIASEEEDSPLNPNGPNFSARAWAKAVAEMVTGAGGKFRTTGVAFQNLNVYGFGTPTDFQKDVLNIWLEAVGLIRKLTGTGKRRIDILRDFNGLVRKGEMLVVLGPPGSGCTTFLKTIAGDFNGIYVDDKSYFNYQGKIESTAG